MLHQHIRMVALGTRPQPVGLCPEGAETTVDIPGPHISHGYAGIFDARISQGGCLGVLQGGLKGSLGPVEVLVQPVSSMAKLKL